MINVAKGLAMAEVAILFTIALVALLPTASAMGVATNIHGYFFYEDGSPAYFDHINITNTRTGVEWNDTYSGIGHPQVALYLNYYQIALDDPNDVQVGDVLMYHAVNGTRTNTLHATYTKLDFEYNITLPEVQTPTPTPTPTITPSPSPTTTFSPLLSPSPLSYTPSPSSAISPIPTVSSAQIAALTPTFTPIPSSRQNRRIPGFEAVFGVVMLLVSYLIRKQKGCDRDD